MKEIALLLVAATAGFGLLFAESPAVNPRTRNLTVDDAVVLALKQNPDILKAIQEIKRLHGVVIQVRAQALPQIALNSSYTQEDRRLLSGTRSSSNQASNRPTVTSNANAGANASAAPGTSGQSQSQKIQNKFWQVTVEANQILYSGGQVKAAVKIAKYTEDSSFYQLRDTIDTVVSTVRQQFYMVLLTRATIRVQEESLRLLENQLSDQKNRFEAGTVPRFNVLQAEVALENARPDLIRARNNYRISQLQLARTLGVDYDPRQPNWVPFNVVGELSIERRAYSLEDAVNLAKAQRPFLKVQRQQILIQVENIKVALAGYQPTIQANGGYEVLNRVSSEDLTDTINGWFFGFTGVWNIFDGLETYGKTKQAKAQLEQAKITYEDSVHQVELEVQQADASLKEASELLQSGDKTIEQAQESLRLAQERLNAGAGVQLDVLNARVALLQAQTTALQARYDYNAALAVLDRVTGAATKYDETFDDPLMRKVSHLMAAPAATPTPPRGRK